MTKKIHKNAKKFIHELITPIIWGFSLVFKREEYRRVGATPLVWRFGRRLYYKIFPGKRKKYCKDILFINGCTLPHPTRYRVDHQIEQLLANGVSADEVSYDQLTIDMLKYYRGFVFFRCPVTEMIQEFIKQAKICNKKCFFDVDDLVIDQKYTDTIEFVKSMSTADKALYNDGVNRMRKTLELCDYAITSTERLQKELAKFTKEVVVNRNVASDEMVRVSIEALNDPLVKKDASKVVIGYFSGSITHNEDFEMILPAIKKLMSKYANLYLRIVGILDVPPSLEPYKDRINAIDFMDWRLMPKELARCDINLAPLKHTIFNEAKSENKWIEAGLVKVVTAASNIGAFNKAIDDGKTGILVDDEYWYESLEKLIISSELRDDLAEAAHREILQNHTTVYTGKKITSFILSKLARNIAFALPSTDISGGINVVFKHAEILRNNGWDVTLIDTINVKTLKESKKKYNYRTEVPGFNIVTSCNTCFDAYFDTMVATLWSTLEFIKKYSNVRNRQYFVQNFETDFLIWGSGKPRLMANASYCDRTNSIKYTTMSLWCKRWLKSKFNKESKYASNGIDLNNYPIRERNFNGKIKILVEGDSSSEYKNTDEAFKIIQKLNPEKFEISYLSYRKEPKDWYRVDHYYNRIPWEKVGEIYAACDILIKTSLLESFSYPPLEMMATGGVSVVLPNDGNAEYLRDGENCLFYQQGNIDDGAAKVQKIVSDPALRKRLIQGGIKTAQAYAWDQRKKDIIDLYE